MKSGKQTNINRSKQNSQKGFTLIEVLVALTLFAIFIITYISSESFNITDSVNMREEITLMKLCESKLNEILLNPPELTESLTLSKVEGNFDSWGYPNYTYKIEYKRLKVPDISKIMGTDESATGTSTEGGSENNETTTTDSGKKAAEQAVQKKVLELIKKNIEEMVWQVQVTVVQKNSTFPLSLSAFIKNKKAKVEINI